MEKKILAATDLYDADAPINAWVGNLGKYNEGYLVGGWIGLPKTDEEIDKFLADVVGIDEHYEEYGVFDWESEYVSYPGEYVDIYAINRDAETIANLNDYDKEILKAANEVFGDIDVDDFDSSDYWFFSDCYTDYDLAYEYIESIGSIEDAVSNPADYIDESHLRRELELDESSYREDYEYEHGEDYDEDEFQEAYENYLDALVDEIMDNPSELLGDNVTTYFDYEQFGRDIRMDLDGDFCDSGFIARVN